MRLASRQGLWALAALLWTAPAAAAVAQALPAPAPVHSASAEDIRDVRGPLHIPPWWRWLAIGGGAACVVSLSAAIVMAVRRRQGKPMTPQERALLRLDQAQTLAESGQVHAYADAASDAVREYIEERFQVRAAHSTTEEFLVDLVACADSPLGSHRKSLVEFLGACDLAKFARMPLAKEEMLSLNRLARRFVLETPQPTPEGHPNPTTQPALARTS
jgi:hypothetical protein